MKIIKYLRKSSTSTPLNRNLPILLIFLIAALFAIGACSDGGGEPDVSNGTGKSTGTKDTSKDTSNSDDEDIVDIDNDGIPDDEDDMIDVDKDGVDDEIDTMIDRDSDGVADEEDDLIDSDSDGIADDTDGIVDEDDEDTDDENSDSGSSIGKSCGISCDDGVAFCMEAATEECTDSNLEQPCTGVSRMYCSTSCESDKDCPDNMSCLAACEEYPEAAGRCWENDSYDHMVTSICGAYNVCLLSEPPPECNVPACGDGEINVDGEECDDGNALPGDGCTGICRIEPGFVCETEGEPCESLYACGNGVNEPGEVCDDGNTESGDGCDETCTMQESGFVCKNPGEPCEDLNECHNGLVTGNEECDDGNENPDDGCDECKASEGYECPWPGALCIPICGDGVLILNEVCDDGNDKDGDGCSSKCDWEDGWACDGPPGNYNCFRTTCGDGDREGAEGCDDGNLSAGDGCSPFCKMEPECDEGHCVSSCGDGIVVGEECDDGNNVNGDGCSDECKVEPGYECDQPEIGDTMEVPIVYRDFTDDHDDFGASITGSFYEIIDLVEDELDDDGKPLYKGNGEVGGGEDEGMAHDGYIDSAGSFAEWYRDNSENETIPGTMILWATGDGSYVNRYNEEGEQWEVATEERCATDDDAFAPCVSENPESYQQCEAVRDELTGCEIRGGIHYGRVVHEYIDGNPLFFPLDGLGYDDRSGEANIPPLYTYEETWPSDDGNHNFYFTSEVRYWFSYDADNTYTLDFTGDDDVWVFINNQLAVDLGGIHTPVNGSVTLTGNNNGFGLEDGEVYEICVFQAERQVTSSSYRLTLSGFNAAESECRPICGDGVMTPGEQCDDGENDGGYGECEEGCVIGEYCGDGIVSGPEECDNGVNDSDYGSGGEDDCAPGCIKPANCGDGIPALMAGEQCDDGVNDGGYGECAEGCKYGPYCGDGVVDDEINPDTGEPYEACDDRINDGGYGECSGCQLGPYCGDLKIFEEFEDCDDGNDVNNDGCTNDCQEIIVVI